MNSKIMFKLKKAEKNEKQNKDVINRKNNNRFKVERIIADCSLKECHLNFPS